jgi:DNA-3-methyladenine glycosylase I
MSEAYCIAAPGDPFHAPYHATEYGFPSREDSVLFERLVLEINQAGLSWLTILKKRPAFTAAFAGWDLDRVAAFDEQDVARLLGDAGIIRNRLKVAAAITNAQRLVALRDQHGSIANWLDRHHPLPKEGWVKLFRQTFVFTGGEIVNEFLMSLGYLPGAHVETCPTHAQVLAQRPPWSHTGKIA